MKPLFKIIKNRYLLTVIALGIWVGIFDKNNIPTQLQFRQDVKQLQEEHDYYAREIKSITADLKELTTNPKTLEKFAREKYLMKRDNEEIYVLVEEKK